jgi:iron(III) transport system substrate-binding protein
VYVSVDEHVARQVLQAFERETGIEVRMVGDSEASKTTGLVMRLRAEHDAPIADVYWSSEALQTIALAGEGVLSEHVDVTLDDWPALMRDAGGRWFAFSPRPRVIVYAPERVDADALPATWEDAVDGRFQGRLVMADPRFGTTGGHLAAMESWWTQQGEPERFDAFLAGLRDSAVRVLPGGNAAVVSAVATGEADIGFTDADDVRAATARGLEVAMLYPRHDLDQPGGGTFLMPNTVAIVAGSPHPEEAARLVAYLLSDETARFLASSISGNMPLQPEVATEFPDLIVEDPLQVDLADAARRYRRTVEHAMQSIRIEGETP